MRVLLAVHHQLDERLGAPGASLAVGAALTRLGHEVEYHGYDQAYPGQTRFAARHQLGYPWRLASFLRRNAQRFDVLDVTTGDAYAWDAMRRPGGGTPVLVTRSNGLEQLASRAVREEARLGHVQLSWKYPLYNGGFRLWEVDKSLRCADGVLLLSEQEREYAMATLRVEPARVGVVAHGLRDILIQNEPGLQMSVSDQPVRLCFIGSWIQRKGASEIVEVTEQLLHDGQSFDLLIAGSGLGEREILEEFSSDARPRIKVVPRFSSEELITLLDGQELLLFPSSFEGFGIALLEAMVRGVAPITTPVGLAPSTIVDGVNGIVVPHHRPDLVGATVRRLAKDRAELLRMRVAARQTARMHTWEAAAHKTVALYESARRHRRAAGKR